MTKRKKSKRKSKDKKIEKTIDIHLSALETEITPPSTWLKAVQRYQNVAPSHVWTINKEEIYQHYHSRFKIYNGPDGRESRLINTTLGEDKKTCDHSKYSHEELVLPNGKVITPIRQFCETKILPPGTNEAFFFDFGKVTTFNNDTEADPVTEAPVIRSTQATIEPRGTRLTIGYAQTEESPLDIISATDRAFSLESIADETVQVMSAVNKLKLHETNHWIDSWGDQINDDIDIEGKLSIHAILEALNIIIKEGLDVSNAVLYTTGKALIDMTTSYEAREYNINNIDDLEKYLGVKLIRSSACHNTREERIPARENIFQRIKRIWFRKERGVEIKGGNGRRSILFLPNITLGLVSGRDLTMEAQRRNELQAINITGTQRVTAIVKNKEGLVLISHA